jgi:hypothetical protein
LAICGKSRRNSGLNGLTDKELRAYFTEIVQNRQEKAKAAKTSPKVTPNGEEEEVDPETKAALKWLEKHGAKAGYVSKKELEALQTKLDKLEGNSAKAEEEKRDSLISEGQEAVTGWLKDAKTPDGKAVELSEEERVDLEELIAAWVNASDARIKRFYTGGATAQTLIKEGFTKALPIVKEGAVAFPNPAKKVVADGKTKLGLMQKTNKPLPKSGDGGDAVVKKADTSNGGKKPLGVYDPALADKAKALIASMRRDAAGE